MKSFFLSLSFAFLSVHAVAQLTPHRGRWDLKCHSEQGELAVSSSLFAMDRVEGHAYPVYYVVRGPAVWTDDLTVSLTATMESTTAYTSPADGRATLRISADRKSATVEKIDGLFSTTHYDCN